MTDRAIMTAQRLAYLQRHRITIHRDKCSRIDAATPTRDQERRRWWLDRSWTRKDCVICGRAGFQLHHARYKIPWPRQVAYLVPLCERHHRDFSVVVWPRLRRKGLDRQTATLFYIVHGERLHRAWATGTSASSQLSLMEELQR